MSDILPIHDAFKRGNLEELKEALGNPPGFPDCSGPSTIGYVLEYAIYHSPLECIRAILELGADPDYDDHEGFPSLIAALSCSERADRQEILDLLLGHGADIQQRGLNDYTPLSTMRQLRMTVPGKSVGPWLRKLIKVGPPLT